MPIKLHLYTAPLFVFILCIALFAAVDAAHAQKVHALLVLLGNDTKITATVEKSHDTIVDLMQLVSRDCEVNLTVMKSKPGLEGEVSHKRLVKTEVKAKESPEQLGIIKPPQVMHWIRNVQVTPADTLLIYFNGHGKIDTYGTHWLSFDINSDETQLARDVLAEELKGKPARLKLLITDTCSFIQDDSRTTQQRPRAFVGVTATARFYAKNLFLQHEGFLDITAASPGELAYGNIEVGGFFTSGIATSLVPDSDTDKDDFLTWREVCDAATRTTVKFCTQAETATIQTPSARSYPVAVSSDTDPHHHGTTGILMPSSLNITSEPSGAIVYIRGKAVGTTPLAYEIATKRHGEPVKVEVKQEGYEKQEKQVTLRSGESSPWHARLEKQQTTKHPHNTTVTWEKDDATMVRIPAGEFRMGTPALKDTRAPMYPIYVDAFYMDTHEVTLAQYEEFLKRTGHRPLPEETYADAPAPNYPVVNVTWDDAVAYAKWAGKRLPTEAEWEKAARGGFVGQKYPWGNAPPDGTQANLKGEADEHAKTAPVGRYLPNEYGLYDVLGNVWEWCADTTEPQKRVLRGNSWREQPRIAWLTERYLIPYPKPHLVGGNVGFRCVVDVDEVQH